MVTGRSRSEAFPRNPAEYAHSAACLLHNAENVDGDFRARLFAQSQAYSLLAIALTVTAESNPSMPEEP
jgi:hypothetical protein